MNDNDFRLSEVPLGSTLLVGNVAVFNGVGRPCASALAIGGDIGRIEEGAK